MSIRKAIITGVNGQDGSYLAELLLDKGYEVHGTIRRSSSFNTWRIDHLRNNDRFKWYYADVTDPVSISNLISSIKPDEFYNLAAQSHVKISFEIPYYTGQVDAIGTLNVLESFLLDNNFKNIIFFLNILISSEYFCSYKNIKYFNNILV